MSSAILFSTLLSGFTFWLQLSLGLLGILLIHDVTGGRWGDQTKTSLRFIHPTFYVLLVCFILVGLGAPSIYPSIKTLGQTTSFIARGLISFVIWISIARGFEKRSADGRSTRLWSGVSLLILLFTVTFASMDWLMALDRNMASTGFGVIFIAGSLCAGFSFITATSIINKSAHQLSDTKKPLLIDLGNLVLMSIMLWAYVDFMQYLIIWSGQIPKETSWYARRAGLGWSLTIALAALLNFGLPMISLLFRKFKKAPHLMLCLVLAILAGRWIESVLWVAPSIDLSATTSLALGLPSAALIGVAWVFVYRSSRPQVQP